MTTEEIEIGLFASAQLGALIWLLSWLRSSVSTLQKNVKHIKRKTYAIESTASILTERFNQHLTQHGTEK